jgi:hypothetical protein
MKILKKIILFFVAIVYYEKYSIIYKLQSRILGLKYGLDIDIIYRKRQKSFWEFYRDLQK